MNHITKAANAHTIEDVTAYQYGKIFAKIHGNLKNRTYDPDALKRYLDKQPLSDGARRNQVIAVKKVYMEKLAARTPPCVGDETSCKFTALQAEYNNKYKADKGTRDLKKYEKFSKQRESSKDVTYEGWLRDIGEKAFKIAGSPMNLDQMVMYRAFGIFCYLMSCNAPVRGDFFNLMIGDRIDDILIDHDINYYHDGTVYFGRRLKDQRFRKNVVPKHSDVATIFNVEKVREDVEKYITSLPPHQTYMFVNRSGNPYANTTRFNEFVREFMKDITGESDTLGIQFLRTFEKNLNAEGVVLADHSAQQSGTTPGVVASDYIIPQVREEILREHQKL